MSKIRIIEEPSGSHIPQAAREELVDKAVSFCGATAVNGTYAVNIIDLFDEVGEDKIPTLAAWLRKNVDPLTGALILIEAKYCQEI